jgi:hypothetical protein
MLTPPAHYHDSTVTGISARWTCLRHLNANTLALALFIALVLLTNSRARDPEIGVSSHIRHTEPQLAVRPCDGLTRATRQEVQGHEFSTKHFRE